LQPANTAHTPKDEVKSCRHQMALATDHQLLLRLLHGRKKMMGDNTEDFQRFVRQLSDCMLEFAESSDKFAAI